MRNSGALLVLLVGIVPYLSTVVNKSVISVVVSAQKLVGRDANGNLVPLQRNARDTEDIEDTRRDLVNRVKFYLHTVKNPKGVDAQQLWIDDNKTLSQSYFDPSKRTRFVTHGWLHSAKTDSCVLIYEAYLKHGDYNVIVVDWSKISVGSFVFARKRVKIIGEYVGKMIDFLASHGTNTNDIIVVGHSLGGHIAGLAALQAKSTVGYVVALDPAQPLFVFAEPGERVARGDANFVQVIHTNAGALGYLKPIGDVDFYPNGGTIQAGCNLTLPIVCSHYRAFRFFAESINGDTEFIGTKCDSYSKYTKGGCRGNARASMGGPEPTTRATGSYYFDTNPVPPYAKGS